MFAMPKFSSKAKMAVLAIIACAGTVNARGCSDREIIAAGVGAIAGAVIVDSADRNPPPHYHHDRECRVERRESCGYVSTYSQGTVYRCVYRDFDTCRGGWRKATVGSNPIAELGLADVAETYKLQEEGASKLIAALGAGQAAQDDESARAALSTICLTAEEMKSVANAGSLSASTVDCMAKALNQDPKQTSMMVASIIETARAQQAAKKDQENLYRN